VARRELRAYLVAPWTYGVAVAFLALTGTLFFTVADGAREASLRFWFPDLAFVLTVTAPIVTSRLLAEEWRSRHLDILLSRPLGPAGLVVGKWLAAVGFFVLLMVPTLAYALFLSAWGRPDWPPLVASYLGAVFLAALFCAVGTMTSAFTPTAVAAGLGAFAILVVSQLANGVDAFRGLSFQPHLEGFTRGAPSLKDAVFFASGTATALILAAAWQALRRRGPGPRLLSRARALALPAVTLAATVAVNLLPVPASARIDFTATKRFTLSVESREVLRNVHREARITAFQPEGTAEARDAAVTLSQFRKANSKIKTRVLDFAKSQGEAGRLGASDDGEVVVEVGERKEVVAPLVEGLISSALQRLERGRPQTLCALAGNGEPELDSTLPNGYETARQAMQANGIETRRLDLTVATAVPLECTILALIGPTAALLPGGMKLINDYLANNGRMLILAEPGGPNLDAITTRWGLRLLPGIVFDPERALAGDPTALAVNSFPTRSPITAKVDAVELVTAGGVTTAASNDTGLTVTPIMESSDRSWLELNPSHPVYEPDKGDRGGPVKLAGAADRSEVKGSGETRLSTGGPSIARTRLLAVTDVDWASNAFIGLLANQRLLINSLNWLGGEEDLVAVPGLNPDLRRLTLTPSRRRMMGMVSIGAIPGVVLLVGLGVWLRRRQR
jgi:ABC-2 type transport system permease protein